MTRTESSETTADVIVVGAAVAGSAVANALGQLGVRTLVLEKGAERDNGTRGDILHPPTLRFLDHWGILDALHADGSVPIKQLAVSHRDLGLLAEYPVQPQGEGPASRSVAVPHDRIEAVMKACAERWPSVGTQRARVTGLLWSDGRVVGVQAETVDGTEQAFRARLVVGCDGSQSLVRRELDIPVDRFQYAHQFLYIRAHGQMDPPNTMHFHLDPQGVIMVVDRPRDGLRICISLERDARGDLLRRPDPALKEYVVSRVPELAAAEFGREDAHVYPLARQVAARFFAPGVALVGDAAHTTHPSGATGMNLAISGAARLAEMVAPVFSDPSAGSIELDAALAAYNAERQPAAAAALEQNHQQAMRIWQEGVQHDPQAYARAINPNAAWGVGGAGWGQDPAALGRNR